ncbi:MAG TPA: hypothetical protein VGD98_19340 [Ktedonobacteraceae bacterium]
MKTRVKFIYTSLLLCLALILTFFTATSTIQAYQHFQQDHQSVQNGDATTVRPWMTLPYISHLYKIPEPCFTTALRLKDHWLVEHATLRVIADHDHQSLSQLIQDVQSTIQGYRHKQLACGPPLQSTPSTSPSAFSAPPRKGKLQ